MSWDLQTIRSTVRRLVGNVQYSQDEFNRRINNYYRYTLPECLTLPELDTFYEFDTTASTGEYALPDTVMTLKAPITIDDGDGDAVTNLGFWQDAKSFFAAYPDDDGAEENEPLDVLLHGATLYLRPIPDDTYTIRIAVAQRPDVLSDDDDTVTNDKWGPVVAYGTAIQILLDMRQMELAAELENTYDYFKTSVNRTYLSQLSGLRPTARF